MASRFGEFDGKKRDMKTFLAKMSGKEHRVVSKSLKQGVVLFDCDGKQSEVRLERVGDLHYLVFCGEKVHDLRYFQNGDRWVCYFDESMVEFDLFDEAMLLRRASQGSLGASGGKVVSPMPGRVVSIKVKPGQNVQRGDGVVVVEAMKMQNEFKSEMDGVVQEIRVKEGDAVESGAVMVVIA